MARIRISDSTFSLILLLSFVPFVIKSVMYIEAGTYVPFFIMDFIGLPMIYGFYYGKLWVVNWLKAWAILMMIFGAIRALLGVLVVLADVGVEAHILGQINIGFYLLCAGYFLGGWYLLKNTNRVLITEG